MSIRQHTFLKILKNNFILHIVITQNFLSFNCDKHNYRRLLLWMTVLNLLFLEKMAKKGIFITPAHPLLIICLFLGFKGKEALQEPGRRSF